MYFVGSACFQLVIANRLEGRAGAVMFSGLRKGSGDVYSSFSLRWIKVFGMSE